VVVAHEIVHSIHKSGEQGIVLKLDYEKTYDRVSWSFLFHLLETRNFDPGWIKWIKHLLIGGSIGVIVNGEESAYFKTGKGLRQGDPLSPLLFNLVGDGLSRMLAKVTEKNLVKGLLENFRSGGIVSLQYADDTILFSKAEDDALRNLKCVLMWYEQISGMRINFHKSELVPLNIELSEAHRLAHVFSCPLGTFPIKYLGVPLHYENLNREDIQPLVDKILKKIAGWRGRLLSQAARAMLIKTCLASILVYLLSFLKFPKWAIKLINTQMRNCLWNDSVECHKYHLANRSQFEVFL
jgi:hypothetical protein